MEMIVDLSRHSLGDALNSHQVLHCRARHRFGGAEMQEQRAFALLPDASDLIQRVRNQFLLAAGAV